MSSNVEVLTRGLGAVRVAGYSHFALMVGDLAEARAFYEMLGLERLGGDMLPDCGRHEVVSAGARQLVALCEGPSRAAYAETGVHYAIRVTARGRDDIVARLTRRGIAVHRYKEDRPAEDHDHVYFFDPFGNRLQLVVGAGPGPILGLDHAAVQAIDVEWEEKFYLGVLGLPRDHVVGWKTADYARARLWGEGKEEMAPGCRRWDKRYNVMHGRDPVPRPNVQLFVKTGDGVIGAYLANEHIQEPPEDQIVGVPRLAFAIRREDIDAVAERLADWGPIVGPVTHPASSPRRISIYCKDPGANFLEFCC
jgi:catechol 2,3-dioxygenase-like lactoylglutathione lyase family enzyme